jgi:hypothetical protein
MMPGFLDWLECNQSGLWNRQTCYGKRKGRPETPDQEATVVFGNRGKCLVKKRQQSKDLLPLAGIGVHDDAGIKKQCLGGGDEIDRQT